MKILPASTFAEISSPEFGRQIDAQLKGERFVYPSETTLGYTDRETYTKVTKASQQGKNELIVDVLGLQGDMDPEYRFGDLTSGGARKLLGGSGTIRPYVSISCGESTALTRIVEATGSSADFQERLQLPLPGDIFTDIHRHPLEISVFDHRGVQAVLRGDPLIGKAQMRLSREDLVSSREHDVAVYRKDKEHGRLRFRAGVLASQADYKVLSQAEIHSIGDVGQALANVISQPRGVDVLLKARPLSHPKWEITSIAEDKLRECLQVLVSCFLAAAGAAKWLNDDLAFKCLAGVGRRAQQIAAVCAPSADADDVIEITLLWIKEVLKGCLPAGAQLPGSERIMKLLQMGASCVGDPREYLESIRVMLPKITDKIATALACRLQMAEQDNECEMFTGVDIVQNGRIASGMAAVIRRSRVSDGAPHVYLYNYEAIQCWQGEHQNDPQTREPLELDSIVKIS